MRVYIEDKGYVGENDEFLKDKSDSRYFCPSNEVTELCTLSKRYGQAFCIFYDDGESSEMHPNYDSDWENRAYGV